MSPIDRFKAACSVTDFAKAPNTTGGFTVWSVTTIVKGGRGDIDGPYFTAEEAAISAELLTSIDKFAKPQASTHCSVWNPDPRREKAIRDDARASRMLLAMQLGTQIPNHGADSAPRS